MTGKVTHRNVDTPPLSPFSTALLVLYIYMSNPENSCPLSECTVHSKASRSLACEHMFD